MAQRGSDDPLILGLDKGSRAVGVVVPLAIAAISAGAIAPWSPPQHRGNWWDVLFSAFMMGITASLLWGPRVVADSIGLTIVNVVFSYWTPWSAVDSIGGSAFLEVTTRDGRTINAWAVQAQGRTFALARAHVERAAAELRAMGAEAEADGQVSGWSRRWCWPRWHHVLAVCLVLALGVWAELA